MIRTATLAACLAALTLSACGGDDEDTTPAANATPAEKREAAIKAERKAQRNSQREMRNELGVHSIQTHAYSFTLRGWAKKDSHGYVEEGLSPAGWLPEALCASKRLYVAERAGLMDTYPGATVLHTVQVTCRAPVGPVETKLVSAARERYSVQLDRALRVLNAKL